VIDRLVLDYAMYLVANSKFHYRLLKDDDHGSILSPKFLLLRIFKAAC